MNGLEDVLKELVWRIGAIERWAWPKLPAVPPPGVDDDEGG
jgi:hypothetical protein